ncbi:polyhydroxyalkanoic acid system family protein [bacterium]|nr:polyhydroxyalkanoic acid system family protein [bacterium]
MPKVNVDVNSKYTAQETFSKIKSIFGENSEIKKFDAQMVCNFNDSQLSATAKGGKFSADISVNPQGDQSQVSIVVEVPFLLSAFKGQIKSTIEKKLSHMLG